MICAYTRSELRVSARRLTKMARMQTKGDEIEQMLNALTSSNFWKKYKVYLKTNRWKADVVALKVDTMVSKTDLGSSLAVSLL